MDDDTTNAPDEKHFPGDASRKGLRELDEHQHHETTEHTAASHPSKATFDETASEVHRAGNPPYEKN
jgi:hypothetical protein